MKKIYTTALRDLFGDVGFNIFPNPIVVGDTIFFVKKPTGEGVATYIKVTYKLKLKLLTFSIGWNCKNVREFSQSLIKTGWVDGYAWLQEAKIFDMPCLQFYNIAEFMGWAYGGMPVNDIILEERSNLQILQKKLNSNDWCLENVNKLLDIYLRNESPFEWSAGNSAIRIAEIAGCIKFLGLSRDCLVESIEKYQPLIRRDMFGLGSSEDWECEVLRSL